MYTAHFFSVGKNQKSGVRRIHRYRIFRVLKMPLFSGFRKSLCLNMNYIMQIKNRIYYLKLNYVPNLKGRKFFFSSFFFSHDKLCSFTKHFAGRSSPMSSAHSPVSCSTLTQATHENKPVQISVWTREEIFSVIFSFKNNIVTRSNLVHKHFNCAS